MNLSKELLEEKEYLRATAFSILEEIGVIETCFCGDTYHLTYAPLDEKEIYAKATNEYKKTERDNKNFDLFHEMVKEILDEAQSSCDCAKCDKDD